MNGASEPSVSTNLNDISDLRKRVVKLEKIARLTETRMVKITEILREITGLKK